MSREKEWFEGRAASNDACPPRPVPLARRIWVWVMIGLVGAAAAAALPSAFAQETWVTVHGLAMHMSGADTCNSITTGAGLEVKTSRDWRTVGGFYRNSNCRWTIYAGEAWMPLHWGAVSFGAVAGAATGYVLPITPAAGASLAYDGKRYGANLIYIPPYQDGGNVLWMQFKARWP